MHGISEWWPELGPKWETSSAPKPPYATIDIHTHVEVPTAAEIAAPFFRPEYDPRMQFQPEESTRYNRELRATQTAQFIDTGGELADMDLQGIDIQALAIAPPQYFHWLDDETGPRVNAMQNDAIFEMTQQAPDRFVGIANLPMDHPEAAVNEMRRVNADLGFNGFEVNADVKGGDLDDRRFDPIWAAAEELEMLVDPPPPRLDRACARWPTTT